MTGPAGPGDIFRLTGDYIARVQAGDGAIPWFVKGKLDPWDHVEAAMGLSVSGRLDEAEAAYRWLARQQGPDGAWFASYQDNRVLDGSRAETNFVAYIATGLWHHYLVSGRRQFLVELWPTVARAMDFVLELQAPSGEIYWAFDYQTGISADALVTGSSSVFKSLDCAARIADLVGAEGHRLRSARRALGIALTERPERFDRTWESKARYSMDWFYPVLTGVVTGSAARGRLASRWQTFVEPGLGCRCVADQPWVTVAETSELVLACLAAGERNRGATLFRDLARFQAEDGSWWTGYVFPDDALWPEERPTWTAAAILLAADALTGHTAAAGLFTDHVT